MKNIFRLATLLVLAVLLSCNRQQPKVEEPLQIDFDLLWKVAQAIPEASRMGDFGQPSSLDQVKETFEANPWADFLYWFGQNEEGDDASSTLFCFKYTGLDKLLVAYQTSEYKDGSYNDQDFYYDYDLKKGKMTPTTLPIQPLGFKDFFDGILLADQTPAKISSYEAEGEVVYIFGGDDYDLLTYFMIPSEAYLPDFEYGLTDRENRLVFDWDGKAFVHHPEKDYMGASIYEDGFCSLDFGSEIPQQLDGFEIERQTYMAEGAEQVKYAITKDGELVMELEPSYDFEKEEFTNNIEVINIYSDRYQTYGEFRVGSLFSEVMDSFADYATTILTADDRLFVDVDGWQFMFDKEDYQGELPRVTSGEGVVIPNPTINPDAEVKMIRMYSIAY